MLSIHSYVQSALSDLHLSSGPHSVRRFTCLFRSREVDSETDVKSPCEGVELDVSRVNLACRSDREQVEALDFKLLVANAGEKPLPEDLVRADRVDCDGFDATDRRRIQDTFDVEGFANECGSTKGLALERENRVRGLDVVDIEDSLSGGVGGTDGAVLVGQEGNVLIDESCCYALSDARPLTLRITTLSKRGSDHE